LSGIAAFEDGSLFRFLPRQSAILTMDAAAAADSDDASSLSRLAALGEAFSSASLPGCSLRDAAADTDDPCSLGGIDIAAFEDEVSSDFLVDIRLSLRDAAADSDDASSLSGSAFEMQSVLIPWWCQDE
jgi:hypothetical protein